MGAQSSRGVDGSGGRVSRRDAGAPDRRFPRSCRLTSRRQYVAVYEKGRRVASSSLVLFGLPNTQGECRLGITVTRKVGGAVVRNRVKRVLREVFRHHRKEMRPALDLVVNARHTFPGKTVEQIAREFLETFNRLARRFR